MTIQEKSAGVLPAPEADIQKRSRPSLAAQRDAGNQAVKDFASLQAKFALLGRCLSRSFRAHDGVITYVVTRHGEARYYSHLHDVQAHLNAILGWA